MIQRIVILFGSIFASCAFSGESSGGGSAVVCRDDSGQVVSAELYDLFEGAIFQAYRTKNSGDSIRLQLTQAVSRLKTQFAKTLTLQYANEAAQNVQFLEQDNHILAAPNDLGETPIVKKVGCDLEGVGYYTESGTLYVSPSVYRKLSNTHKAAFYAHESLYRVARRSFQNTSLTTRRLVAALFAKRVRTSQIERLARDVSDLLVEAKNSYVVLPEGLKEFRVRFSPENSDHFRARLACRDVHGRALATVEIYNDKTNIMEYKGCNHFTFGAMTNYGWYLGGELNLSVGNQTFFSQSVQAEPIHLKLAQITRLQIFP